MAERERGGGKEGREEPGESGSGGHSTRESVKRRTSIKSARDDGLSVCGGEERLREKRE